MNNKTFEMIVEDSLDICKAVLTRKSKEYSSSDDKLHNFDKAKDLMRCKTKEFALWGMFAKHLVSVTDMVERFEKAGELPTSNMIDEKIGDSINYFILLKACFYDDMIKSEAEKPCKCGCGEEVNTEASEQFKKMMRENPEGYKRFKTEIEQLERSRNVCFDKNKDIEI